MLVDVHLDELDLATGGLDHILDDGSQLLAGAAPGRPEIDEHGLAGGFGDDVAAKGCGRRFLDEVRLSGLNHLAVLP